MGASPAKFLFGFLFVSIVLWISFMFASRLVAWILSRVMGASIGFRVGGWKCLRDIYLKFNKGPIESISVGEVRLSLRQSLIKIGVGFMSRDPKLQVVICDLEVIMRSSTKTTKKTRSKKSRSPGRGKWMVLANMARFLSVSVTDFSLKNPKATLDIKELRVDISKDGGSEAELFVKLQLFPINVHLGEPHLTSGGSSSGCQLIDGVCPPFSCEEFSLLCEIGHNRETGVVVRDLDITCGQVSVNLNEELLLKKKDLPDKSSQPASGVVQAVDKESVSAKSPRGERALSAVSMLPEKAAFTLPKLDVKFVHRSYGLTIDNNIMGIQLKCMKSCSIEDVGESVKLDVQMEFSEIHLLRETGIPVVEILKLDVVSSIYIPLQPSFPIRSEVDVKLGGTQCNLLLNRLESWACLRHPQKPKQGISEDSHSKEQSHLTEQKPIMWTCTVSAPEMTVVLFSLTGSPLYHGCSQSSHIFANNISGTGTTLHLELGELNLHMSDEYQECLKESLFGVETNTGSLMHIAKISLDLGKKDMDPPEDGLKSKMVLGADVTGMGVYLTYRRLESLVSTALSVKALGKKLSASNKKPAQSKGMRSSRPSGKGIQHVKLNLERCSVNVCGDVGLEDIVVPDPKRVNYGSQGGRVLIANSADGTSRTAHITSTFSNEAKKMKYTVSLDIYHFNLCMNKERKSMQFELERARSIYQEFPEDGNPGAKVDLLDMQNAKLIRRSGGPKEIEVCCLFSATDISLRWEPDVHIALFELGLHLNSLTHNHKPQGQNDGVKIEDREATKETSLESVKIEKPVKKRQSIFAVDVEMLTISAEVGDGVETLIQVQSIFSENARIGVLVEGLMLQFNKTRIFRSSRMQISRVPNVSGSLSDVKSENVTTWDWVIQAIDVHICMPFRLELRAIDDAVEEMLRVLKLVTSAKTKRISSPKKEPSKPPKKSSSTRTGCIKFGIRKLTADIEEEPIQGWLDEHYKLLKNEARELAVRLDFLEELISRSSQGHSVGESNDSLDGKIQYNGEEINFEDVSAIQKLREEIYKKSFGSYYKACQGLVPSEGSGACKDGFQAGFKPSTARTSLLSICATELDLMLTKIEGGDAGMIEVLQKLDPVSRAHNIPFSKLYGANINLRTGSLAAKIRNYTCPLLATTGGRCEGRVILAQQATPFQPQIRQDVYLGRWRKVNILRSASGTTPPVKTYLDLPIHFQKGEVSFGVGWEPSLADISYAFTVALRRANLSIRNPNPVVQPPKKEKSLPWWDEMRNYIHGNAALHFSETIWNILATTDPYETLDKLQVVTGYMEIQQSDGRVYASAKDFKIFLSSLESLLKNSTLKHSSGLSVPFLEAPIFTLEVTMDWDCESGHPLNHYLFALPCEGVPREKVFDPFRSTSLSLRWNFSLRPSLSSDNDQSQSSSINNHVVPDRVSPDHLKPETALNDSTMVNLGHHDLAWILKFWNLNFLPPHKLRMFSRWPRFGVPRIPRSGNLSLDRVMTEFMFRIDATPTCIRHMPLHDDDPAKGLTFKMTKVKYELYNSRGKQKYTFDCKREPLDLVYQGLDLHMPKAYINKDDCATVARILQMTRKKSQSASMERAMSGKNSSSRNSIEKHQDDGFLLSSDYFTIRKQAPKADPERLLAWQEAGRRNLEMTYVRSEFENGSESDDHTRSDPSDDDGYNVVIADNCQRIFVYGLKLLWTLENRDAVWSWVGGLSKAFAPPKPSPSRQYAQRKLHEENNAVDKPDIHKSNDNQISSSVTAGASSSQIMDISKSPSSPSQSETMENSITSAIGKLKSIPDASLHFHIITCNGFISIHHLFFLMQCAFLCPYAAKYGNIDDSEEEGTRHFMVNVIEPQFNLHSEESNGRFLLAAVSGRVLARSFHSVLHVGYEVIEQALGGEKIQIPETQPEMTWNRMEFSVMLEHVQAHVAPTDVDPGAGLQWLPKIRRSSPKVKRTGALLERVFMPCDMYFRYTRHKGGTSDLKVKPLKELIFNSHNITAAMTSRQFQVMLDVLTNLLFARLPKPRKSSLSYSAEDDEDVEEEADEVVPDGVEEVELAKVELEQKERVQRLIFDDIRKLSLQGDTFGDPQAEMEVDLWMVTNGRFTLVQKLKRELINAQKARKAASASLRLALQKAAQLRLMEKEKNKSPSYAMRISLQINKVVWGMLVDGKSFAEAEINDMIYDFDRDYKDVGVAKFTTKYFVVRNCLPNAKSDMLLSAWNPPSEWGKKVMLRVDAKQGFSKDGNSPLELFQVEIYPLKIHLTESLYRVMWQYLFPEEEQDSQRRQQVWKGSTTAGLRRAKKATSVSDASTSANHTTKDAETSKSSTFNFAASSATNQSGITADSSQASKLQNSKATKPELRRTSSFDRTWEENVAESVANELVLQLHSSSKHGSALTLEQQDEATKTKLKDIKLKPGRSSHEEKKSGKMPDEKRSQPRKLREFHNIKISQVELLVTDGGSAERGDQQIPIAWPKRPADGAGDGFVTSIRGLFNSQRRKAKAFVLRTMRGEAENELHGGDWSESDAEFSPFARQLTITKAKRLIRRHTKKFRSRGHKGLSLQHKESFSGSPREGSPFEGTPFEGTPFEESDSSSGSSLYEDSQIESRDILSQS
ncbi:Golgi-body localisation protein domain [Striga asiatica]|uniref:Golgi-body localisation protein domain n=1 Tax=Striga asiatica TaxID=4170 RepID=A0A5A7PWW0_STRAF|nr:Golgi-body localisation protein domain [Striga asiatica]